MNETPRRNDLQRNTPAELAIRKAMGDVEMVGAHVLLTDAICLLDQALDRLADYVDLQIEVGIDPFRQEHAPQSAAIGRIVHFVLGKIERPAIIVRVWSPTCVQLQVFNDGDGSEGLNDGLPNVTWNTSVDYCEEASDRSWHWPQQAHSPLLG